MSEDNISLKAIKLGFLGDSTVGKTALCNALLNIEFNPDLLSTIGKDRLETKFPLENGKEIKVILWDTAGQERFRSMALKTIKAVQGVVLVFDVTKKDTFENINNWLEEIKNNLNKPSLVLLGNKIDLPEEKRQITTEEAKSFAKSKGLAYFETSAKTKQGINEGFSYIVNETYKKVESKNSGHIEIGSKPVKEKTGCFGKKKSKSKK